MPKSDLNVALKGLDDLFSTEENRQEEQREQVQQIPIEELFPFKNHPFKVLDDESMQRTVESVEQYGVLSPLIARPRPEGGYEIISGHRRQHAAQLAGLDALPVIVRQMDDDAAVLLMVDSNLQRENILPSERAFAYKMKLEALKNQGARSDLTSPQVAAKFRSDDAVAKDQGISGDTVRRYIRLTNLVPELLDMVDEKKIAFNPAVELSYLDTNRELKEAGLRALKIVIATMPVMMFAMNVTTLAVVWFGGNLIIGGRMAVGDLTAFTTYIVQILMSLMMLSMVFLQSSRAMASIRRIDEVLDEPIDLSDENASQKDRKVEKGRVEFKDVSFSYREGGEPVLSHISLTAEPGETIGILGATGSGKTSLVQLIPRLYDVTEGSVRVDGIDVREYSLKNLRDGVGMVLQKNVLFSGTIEENLRWGDETATEEEVRRAAVYAQADSFVNSFAEGYKTEMGQGGVNVSGGQKQRLCIARALLKKPKILILDDSTSAVDTATEAAIRTAFREDLKDTTKFIIAQRLSSLEYADRILVLEDGRIIGEGTQEKLLASCEAYREIYETQYGKRADGEGMA